MKLFKKLFIALIVVVLTLVNVKASENLSIETKTYNYRTGELVIGGNTNYSEVMVSVFEDGLLKSFKTTTKDNNSYRATFIIKFKKNETITIKVGDINSTEYVMDTLDVEKYNSDVTVKTPKITVKNANNNTLLISWNEEENQVKAEVYRSENKKTWKKVKTVTTNSYTDTGLTYGKTYYYKVKVIGSVNSKTSSVVSGKTVPNKVSLSIISAGSNNIKLGWGKVKVTGYEIQVSTDGKKWSKEKTITKNNTLEYNDTKLKENKRYYYKVRAYKTVSGKKVYGPWSNVVNTKTAPKKASLKVTLRDYNAMNIDMGEAKGATKYILQKSIDDKTYTLIEEFPNKGRVDQTEQELGRVYYFRLRVCNSENRCSGWVKANLRQTTKVPGFKLSTSSKKVVVELGRVNGADGYQIYGSTKKNGTYKLLKEFSSEEEVLKYTQKTTKGKTYYYKVRSFKLNTSSKRVYSPLSGIKSIKSK